MSDEINNIQSQALDGMNKAINHLETELVKNPDHPFFRRHFVNTPQKIMFHFFFRGYLKGTYRNALRVHGAKYISDQSIFPAGIHTLQYHQYGVFAFGI